MIRATSGGGERPGVSRHAALPQRLGQFPVAADSVVEIAQGAAGCGCTREIHEGKFRFAVLLNLEHNQVDFE